MQEYVVEKKINIKILSIVFILISAIFIIIAFFVHENIQKRKIVTIYDYIAINDYDNASFIFRTLYEKEPFNASVLKAGIDLYYEILVRSDSKSFVELASERVVSYGKQLMLVSVRAKYNYIIHQKIASSFETMGPSYYYEAYNSYRQAISLGDKRTSAKIRLATVCANLKKYDEAIVYYNLARNERKPANIDIEFTDDIKYKLGVTYEAIGDILSAIKLVREVFDSKKNDKLYLSACLKLAELYKKQELTESVIFYYKKALEVDAKNPNLYYNIGVIYQNDKKIVDAKKMFNEALQIDKKHAPSQNALKRLR